MKTCFHPIDFTQNNTNERSKKPSTTNFDNNSHHEHDLKRPQMISIELKAAQTTTKSNKRNKNILEGGSLHQNIEFNDQFLDEILHYNNP